MVPALLPSPHSPPALLCVQYPVREPAPPWLHYPVPFPVGAPVAARRPSSPRISLAPLRATARARPGLSDREVATFLPKPLPFPRPSRFPSVEELPRSHSSRQQPERWFPNHRFSRTRQW